MDVHGTKLVRTLFTIATVALTDGKRTDAMKVLVEHERGLTVAFYVPCHKTLVGGWQFGEMFVQPAEPEIKPWMNDGTS